MSLEDDELELELIELVLDLDFTLSGTLVISSSSSDSELEVPPALDNRFDILSPMVGLSITGSVTWIFFFSSSLEDELLPEELLDFGFSGVMGGNSLIRGSSILITSFSLSLEDDELELELLELLLDLGMTLSGTFVISSSSSDSELEVPPALDKRFDILSPMVGLSITGSVTLISFFSSSLEDELLLEELLDLGFSVITGATSCIRGSLSLITSFSLSLEEDELELELLELLLDLGLKVSGTCVFSSSSSDSEVEVPPAADNRFDILSPIVGMFKAGSVTLISFFSSSLDDELLVEELLDFGVSVFIGGVLI